MIVVIVSVVLALGIAATAGFIGLVLGHLSTWPVRAKLEADKAALEAERNGLMVQIGLLNESLSSAASDKQLLSDIALKQSAANTELINRLDFDPKQQDPALSGTQKECPICGVTCESATWPNTCPKCGTLYGAPEPVTAEVEDFKEGDVIDG